METKEHVAPKDHLVSSIGLSRHFEPMRRQHDREGLNPLVTLGLVNDVTPNIHCRREVSLVVRVLRVANLLARYALQNFHRHRVVRTRFAVRSS